MTDRPSTNPSPRRLVEPPPDDDVSPFQPRYSKRQLAALRRVQRVSRHAALQTKSRLWDSNDVSIDAAVAAVDQWEALYNALRAMIITSVQSARGVYGAAKEGASQIEHGFWLPVRDWILLPAFGGVERATTETIRFFQSEHAEQLVQHSLGLVKQVPVVGENLLAPALWGTVGVVQRTWDIVQYPIPSKQQVRDTVDFALNGTKWALMTAGREICLYLKRADANITRTLSHTQWKVLGSGPYATLDKLNKREVIDHLCERYFSLTEPLARYELAAHIQQHNAPLYHDLVLTGLLQERGARLTEDDEWLSTYPVYRHLEGPFLIPNEDEVQENGDARITPLWFRLPYVNGKHPGRDAPWVCFPANEQKRIEERYQEIVRQGQSPSQGTEEEVVETATDNHETLVANNISGTSYLTVAKWYNPDVSSDVLVDQKRHAVSFFFCCPKCRRNHEPTIPPLAQKQHGDLCAACAEEHQQIPYVAALRGPPPITSLMRPSFWRFHGPGDEVRRATWFLDTPRHGLQPFDEEAQAVLEDAYLFLKWLSIRQEFGDVSSMDEALLTVEVVCPDGAERLVQFSSLTRATAIQKGLYTAVSLFKRRVYRGAWLIQKNDPDSVSQNSRVSVEQSIIQAVKDNGALGETLVPNTGLRDVLTPLRVKEEGLVILYHHGKDDLAVPPERLWKDDMARFLNDNKDNHIDHLCLVVHGIGEMMQSVNVLGFSMPNLSSIIDCCGYMRKNHSEVQEAHFAQMYPTVDSTTRASTGRVEYLPVEWHEAFSILSQRRKVATSPPNTDENNCVMIDDISLRTIPNMREFANDTLMDVLYFMSPEHHDIIVSIVSNEMNVVVERFCRLTKFTGRISLIGHSLGSIISWDILAHQAVDFPIVSLSDSLSSGSLASYPDYEYQTTITSQERVTDTPELTQQAFPPASLPSNLTAYPQLDFSVENFFLLGSPVAVFLMIRNQRRPLTEEFALNGCDRVFNIFHPYDPIAYRIEPCIHPRNAEFEPSIMKHWNGGFRVQYQTKRLWRKLLDTTWETQQNVVEAFEASMARMGLLDATIDAYPDDDASTSVDSSDENRCNRVMTGQLNRGRRIDFMLQEKEIETANEYVSALAAHSSYWMEKDLSLFIARQIYLSTLEQAALEAENASWEPILPIP